MFQNLKSKNNQQSIFKNSLPFRNPFSRSPSTDSSVTKTNEGDRLVRCRVCGFICDRERDIRIDDGKWAGLGIQQGTQLTGGASTTLTTKLLLLGEGADASVVITDETGTHTVTPETNCQIDTTTYHFGSSSIQFDGVGDYLHIPDNADTFDCFANLTDIRMIDFWAYHSSIAGTQVYFSNDTPAVTANMHFQMDGEDLDLEVTDRDGNSIVSIQTATDCIDADEWQHIAIVKVGANVGLYLNGVQVGFAVMTATTTFDGNFYMGDEILAGNYLAAHIDNFRIEGSNPLGAAPNVGVTDIIAMPTETAALRYTSDTSVISDALIPKATIPTPDFLYWKCDDNADTTTVTTAVGTVTGTSQEVTTAAMTTLGKVGTGLLFSDYGAEGGDWILTGSSLSAYHSFSISAWIQASSTDYAGHIVQEGRGAASGWSQTGGGTGNSNPEMHLSIGWVDPDDSTQYGGLLSFYVGRYTTGDGQINLNTAFEDTSGFHHVVAVAKNMGREGEGIEATAQLYLDGELADEHAVGELTDSGLSGRDEWTEYFRAGKPAADDNYFFGTLDNLMVWTVALDSGHVESLYNNGAGTSSYGATTPTSDKYYDRTLSGGCPACGTYMYDPDKPVAPIPDLQ